MRKYGILAVATLIAPFAFADGGFDSKALLQNFVRPSVVRIDPQYPNSVVDGDGQETCATHGTGFIIDSTHVVTSRHVFDLGPKCGDPSIVAHSFFAPRAEWALDFDPQYAESDIAILSTVPGTSFKEFGGELVDPALPPCSLPLAADDVDSQTDAYRYGYAGDSPSPSVVPGSIGAVPSGYGSYYTFTLVTFDRGESGGPIVHSALAVGVMERSLDQNATVGLFLPVSFIGKIIDKVGLGLDTSIQCDIYAQIRRGIKVEAKPFGGKGIRYTAKVSPELFGGPPSSGFVANAVKDATKGSRVKVTADGAGAIAVWDPVITNVCLNRPGLPPACKQVVQPAPPIESVLDVDRTRALAQQDLTRSVIEDIRKAVDG